MHKIEHYMHQAKPAHSSIKFPPSYVLGQMQTNRFSRQGVHELVFGTLKFTTLHFVNHLLSTDRYMYSHRDHTTGRRIRLLRARVTCEHNLRGERHNCDLTNNSCSRCVWIAGNAHVYAPARTMTVH